MSLQISISSTNQHSQQRHLDTRAIPGAPVTTEFPSTDSGLLISEYAERCCLSLPTARVAIIVRLYPTFIAAPSPSLNFFTATSASFFPLFLKSLSSQQQFKLTFP